MYTTGKKPPMIIILKYQTIPQNRTLKEPKIIGGNFTSSQMHTTRTILFDEKEEYGHNFSEQKPKTEHFSGRIPSTPKRFLCEVSKIKPTNP